MIATIYPGKVTGTIYAAASKSAMQRACALALLHPGKTIIKNPGKSNDDKAALSIVQSLGATISETGGTVEIENCIDDDNITGEAVIDCGESGLSIRMFAPVAALQQRNITVTGKGSLVTRPMDFFDSVFPSLGIEVATNHGRLPLKIRGPLKPANITIDGSLSSQFLTGLLIAIGKQATETITIRVTDLKSKPYIDLTLQMMAQFGYRVQNNGYASFIISPVKKDLPAVMHYTVEGDWSGAAFLLVAGAVSGNVVVKGLDVFSAQADKAILQVLMMAKATLSISPEAIVVSAKKLEAFHFDATDCPDLFPPVVALAACCDGTSVIQGVSRLAHKESNRALTLQEVFGKLGVTIRLQDDLMLIEGGGAINGARTSSHHDHRIAMALSVAALKATGPVSIDDAEAIDKSYPDFYRHLQALGAQLSITT